MNRKKVLKSFLETIVSVKLEICPNNYVPENPSTIQKLFVVEDF